MSLGIHVFGTCFSKFAKMCCRSKYGEIRKRKSLEKKLVKRSEMMLDVFKSRNNSWTVYLVIIIF